MIKLFNNVMGIEVELVSQDAYLLKDEELPIELFGLRQVFLQPLFGFRDEELFLEHLELYVAVAGEEI